MARQITAYSCEHGCRRRPVQSRKRMEAHEQKCIANPEQRTCKTCSHDYFHNPVERGCSLHLVPEGERLVRMCPEWESRYELEAMT